MPLKYLIHKEMSHGENRAEQITKHNLTKKSEDLRLLTQPKGHMGRPRMLKSRLFKIYYSSASIV